MGMRAGWRAPASTSVGESPRHRDADAQPARPWRGCAGGYFRVPGVGGIARFPPPAVRRRDRRPADGVREGRRAGASLIYAVAVGGCRIVLCLDADAQPPRPWRNRAGRYLRDARSPRLRLPRRASRSPPSRGPSRRPLPAARRRDRRGRRGMRVGRRAPWCVPWRP